MAAPFWFAQFSADLQVTGSLLLRGTFFFRYADGPPVLLALVVDHVSDIGRSMLGMLDKLIFHREFL